MTVIEFGEYKPDVPALRNDGLTTIANASPYSWGYKQFATLESFSSALPERARGFISADTSAGIWYGYTGTSTKLHMLASETWADAGTGYSLTSAEEWSFLKWETQVFAASIAEHVQADTIGAGSFSALITSTKKPKARHMGKVGDFLVLGNTDEATDGTRPNGIYWSAQGDPTDFDASIATQSGSKIFRGDGGAVQGIVGGTAGMVFLERDIQRMTHQGPPLLFSFDPISEKRGAIAAGSIIRVGNTVYFLDRDGYYGISLAGGEPFPLGKERVDSEVLGEFDETNTHRVSAVYDSGTSCILWSRPRTSGNPDRIDVYNISADRWSEIELDHELLASDRTRAFNIDASPMSGWNIDVDVWNIDSSAYKGGAVRIGAFDTANRLAYFTGTGMDATFETGETQLLSPHRSYIDGVRPLITGSSAAVTVTVGTRENLTDSVTWGTETAVNGFGTANIRASGKYMRFRVKVTGGFDDAMGVDIEPKRAGLR